VWNKISERGDKISRRASEEAGMKGKELQASWKGLSEEILEGIAAWREEHPKATMREIEEEIDKRLSGLRATMLTDTANASGRAGWETGEGVACPDCGAKLVKKGRKKRVLLTRDGREVQLDREYAVCPVCGQGIFPPG
jgi:DNA-directed RNA polymerase subunit RPC12/RpoP